MKQLIRQITDKSQELQKRISAISNNFIKSETNEQKELHLTEILHIFDELIPVVSFIMQNQDNVEAIINSRKAARDAYKEITGRDYDKVAGEYI
jgi:bifunctional N-acetylglucosamine-1-phosphate-uridyltransferase/glucosamine-1-phosphate-acetyltransferase GlmU-like protein